MGRHVIVLLLSAAVMVVHAQNHEIEGRRGAVQLNNKMEDKTPEVIPTQSVEEIKKANGVKKKIYLVKSKPITFDHNRFEKFALFKQPLYESTDDGTSESEKKIKRTHIDLRSNPDGLNPSFETRRPIDTDEKLQFADWVFAEDHAGTFPVRAEGNLIPKSNGKGGTKCLFHWAGKIDSALPKSPILYYTKWLVTHDPKFEKEYAQKSSAVRQAELMNNKAEIILKPAPGATYSVTLYYQATIFGFSKKTKIVDAHKAKEKNGLLYYELRLFKPKKTKTDKKQTKTDEEGNIYVEGQKLDNGPSKNYRIVVKDEKTNKTWEVPIRIGPLLTDLDFAPKIQAGETFDPYTNEYDIGDPEGYGMQINYYLLEDDVEGCLEQGAVFGIENDPEVPEEEKGDCGETHLLHMSEKMLTNGDHKGKWEGFNSNLKDRGQIEKIDETLLNGKEAELSEPNWAPGQKWKGIAPQSVCAEGKYIMRVELKRKEDPSQVQKIHISFEVKYRFEK